MKSPLFSIITPTYNRANSGYLEQNIRSIQSQKGISGFEYEHIIVDDGSTDSTSMLVKRLAKKDKHIKYVYQPNSGVAKAIQNGISNSSGDFVAILDDDDLFPDDSLSIRAGIIKGNPKVDFFYGLADWIDEYGLPIPATFQSKELGDYPYEKLLVSNYINGGTPTIRRSELIKVKWPDWIERSQDYFLWLELFRPERNLKLMFIEKVVSKCRYHSQNYTAAINDDQKRKAKAMLNLKVKQLHPDNLVYLAEEAFKWVNEAHASNKYRQSQIKEKNARIDELQQALDYYALSRVVKLSVKTRNVVRGQVVDRLKRLHNKSKKALLKRLGNTKPLSYELVENKPWDKKGPLVSVITPFFNRDDTMPETIHSVLGQTFQDFEYIIVDDGSSRLESKVYLDKINHPKIKIIRQSNQGVAAARNKGVANARGKYIVCLDSDDFIEPTYLEKSVIILETNPNVSLVTYDMRMFGVKNEIFNHQDYDPYRIMEDNSVLTSSVYRKELWVSTDGYKSGIGYEDWEFWVNAAEHGHFGIHIPEKLFNYRTSEVSRYIDDMSRHHQHVSYIKEMHPNYRRLVKSREKSNSVVKVVSPKSALINMQEKGQYKIKSNKKQVMLVVPWMTFGGAETLIYNYCKEVKGEVDITFVTGLKSPNEWEYKFNEISSNIYHLANLFDNESLYLEFISNLIKTRGIDIMHIVHSGYAFSMLEVLKKRHPHLRVIVTLFNDKAAYFEQAIGVMSHIDSFTTDNNAVANHFRKRLPADADVRVIPNGVDADNVYNPELYDRQLIRKELDIKDDEYGVFFIGRLSEEKNPDVFVEAARQIVAKKDNFKFIIIGDGKMRDEIEEQIGKIKTDKISYIGYKSDVARYLSAADIFVLPSSIEGFPLSILESMSMRVVTISSEVGAVPDVIMDGGDGYIVKPGSVDEIVRAIENAIKDMTVFHQVQANSRTKIISKYSTKQLGENYLHLYGVKK